MLGNKETEYTIEQLIITAGAICDKLATQSKFVRRLIFSFDRGRYNTVSDEVIIPRNMLESKRTFLLEMAGRADYLKSIKVGFVIEDFDTIWITIGKNLSDNVWAIEGNTESGKNVFLSHADIVRLCKNRKPQEDLINFVVYDGSISFLPKCISTVSMCDRDKDSIHHSLYQLADFV